MSWQNKPGLDWSEVRSDYEDSGKTGMSVRAIADKHGISHKALQKRRDKEGWQRPDAGKPKDDLTNLIESLPSIVAQANSESGTRVRTSENAKVILDQL